MLLNLEQLRDQYNMNITGIIHIGAHHGEEYPLYAHMGMFNVIYFEPDEDSYKVLCRNVNQGAVCIMAALGDKNCYKQMWVANNQGVSSSFLEPEQHLEQHPTVGFNKAEQEVMVMRLDDFWKAYVGPRKLSPLRYNMINMDVQGYELKVLQGGVNTLEHIHYIMTEVNRDEVYKDCAQVEELDEFLVDFDRVETTWDGGTWGDALYIRR